MLRIAPPKAKPCENKDMHRCAKEKSILSALFLIAGVNDALPEELN